VSFSFGTQWLLRHWGVEILAFLFTRTIYRSMTPGFFADGWKTRILLIFKVDTPS
jgi:hypothetical protein